MGSPIKALPFAQQKPEPLRLRLPIRNNRVMGIFKVEFQTYD